MYSSELTEHSQTYSRTNCTLPNHYYKAIQFKVVKDGCYMLTSNSTLDTYGYVYKDIFNPLDPTMNLISKNDNNLRDNQFELISSFQSNTAYILVVTTYKPNVTGSFLIIISGPSGVSFNPSEYLYFFVRIK